MDAKSSGLGCREMGFLHYVKVSPQKILTDGKENKCQGHDRQMKVEKLSQIEETEETWKPNVLCDPELLPPGPSKEDISGQLTKAEYGL